MLRVMINYFENYHNDFFFFQNLIQKLNMTKFNKWELFIYQFKKLNHVY